MLPRDRNKCKLRLQKWPSSGATWKIPNFRSASENQRQRKEMPVKNRWPAERMPTASGKMLDPAKKFLQKIGRRPTAHGKLTMAFRRSDLQEAFFVPGTYPFRVWGYGTTDPLEEVLSPGYFRIASNLLRRGELIYVSARACHSPSNGAAADEPRMALVMIGADERDASRAGGSVRLVQDFGRPSDRPMRREVAAPAASDAPMAPVPVKRGRGRPPGSRNKKSE